MDVIERSQDRLVLHHKPWPGMILKAILAVLFLLLVYMIAAPSMSVCSGVDASCRLDQLGQDVTLLFDGSPPAGRADYQETLRIGALVAFGALAVIAVITVLTAKTITVIVERPEDRLEAAWRSVTGHEERLAKISEIEGLTVHRVLERRGRRRSRRQRQESKRPKSRYFASVRLQAGDRQALTPRSSSRRLHQRIAEEVSDFLSLPPVRYDEGASLGGLIQGVGSVIREARQEQTDASDHERPPS